MRIPWKRQQDTDETPKPKRKKQPRQRYRRSEPLTVKSLWSEYLKKGWKYALFLTLVWGNLVGSVVANEYFDDTEADARALLVSRSEMSWVAPDKRVERRKELAKSLLVMDQNGMTTDIHNGASDNVPKNEILREIKEMAQTGDSIQLDTTRYGYTDNTLVYLIPLLLATLCIASIMTSIKYIYRSALRYEFYADLPWKRGWPFLFLALEPLLIPLMIISAVQMFARKPTNQENEADPEFEFDNDPEGAREYYFTLRSGEWLAFITDRKVAIEERLAELKARTKAIMTERGQLQAEQRELNKSDVTVDIPDADSIQAEFDSILAQPSVQGVQVGEDDTTLNIFVKARFTMPDGKKYDLGDWAIVINGSGLTTVELRRGTKRDWHVLGHPIYRLGDGVFCFGARIITINTFMKEGRISEAILQAVAGLNSINEADVPSVPSAFKEATD